MNKKTILYHQTGYFSQLILDYLDEKESLQPFYNNSFSIDGLKKQLEEKQFSKLQRETLHQVLIQQYKGVDTSKEIVGNLELLLQENTFTVTTGHQLNLFTGPLYFIYKIITAINLAKELKQAFPDKNFVPVFWMASEDHDFEEVNHFNLFGVKHEISTSQKGAVGRMKIENIEDVFNQLEETLKGRTGLEDIISKLKEFYQEGKTFTEANRNFINHLFEGYGLVIIDGDDARLKAQFSPIIKDELLNHANHSMINNTSDKLLELGYKKQVNPRELNLFYLIDNLRERIVFEDNSYKVLNTTIQFSEQELLDGLTNFPERFSPNVVMRPLYQESVLPNLAYIGGGGELAYWFQLKEMFEYNKVEFPILVLRNSALIIDKGTQKKLQKLGITEEQLFTDTDQLIKGYLKEGSEIILTLQNEEKQIEEVFTDIITKAGQIDQSLQPMVKAELQKSLKSIKNIEGRLIKAEKQKDEVGVSQIQSVKQKLFPSDSLQERKDNLIYAYMLLQEELIPTLIESFDPFKKELTLINLG